MRLKAMLLCEDIRFEVGGTVTLVGVYNERLIAPPGEGELEVPRLAWLAVVGGLRGVDQLRFRQWIRLAADDDGGDHAWTDEPHDPRSDEHNFAFSQIPAIFPGTGTYELALDVEVGGRAQGYRYQFVVERRVS